MLRELLQRVAAGGTQYTGNLARELQVSETLLQQMLGELVRHGYIQPAAVGCSVPCETCPLGALCATDRARVWRLTAKGQRFVEVEAQLTIGGKGVE
jgi:hypothetical protein